MAERKSSEKPNNASSKKPAETAQKKNASSVAKKKPEPVVQKTYGKEIAGVICLLAGVVIFFCGFDKTGIITRFVMGLLGPVGTVFLPIGLVLCFMTLTFHGGKPVTMRLICSILSVFLVSVICHLAVTGAADSTHNIGELYTLGKAKQSGGVFGGLLAYLFSFAGGRVGAWVIGLILLVVVLCAALNLTLTAFFRALNKKREDNVMPAKKRREPAEVIVDRMAQHQVEREVKRQYRTGRSRFDYDLPVDDPPAGIAAAKPKSRNGALPPDEYIRRRRQEAQDGLPDEPLSELKKNRGEQPAPAQSPVRQEPVRERLPEEPPVSPKPVNTPPERTPVQKPVEQPAAPKPVNTLPERPAQPVSPVSRNPEPEYEDLPPVDGEEHTEKVRRAEARRSAREIAAEIKNAEEERQVYVYPDVSLLNRPSGGVVDGSAEIEENTRRLQETLQCFNVDAEIINVTRGPSVTMYELELAQGVRLNRLTTLADDIALSLGAASVRISAIPDKISVVGIEIPNKLVTSVPLREVLDSSSFRNANSKVSFAVGKDIAGSCIVGDVAKLPHMLIAGTTGSGKSVCMNSIIISLLFKSSPEEVRLIMIDPKMVELSGYNGIPHLLIPVVTEPKKAAGALQWTVSEMMRRYRMMSEAGVRDLESYNKQAREMDEQKPMEQIVVVVDELADLMMVAAKEVEESICRIAQMGRAAGIHLLIATQRPSANVITGLMKANIPSRIAFAVSSAMESRIILDTAGAEKLVGKGDMLYAPLGKGKPKRVQGTFVSEDEVRNVVEFIKSNNTANYADDVQQQIDMKAEQQGNGSGKAHPAETAPEPAPESDESGDELFPAAVEVILETKQASVSMLQRRLKLGYARAARIVDEMEERGIVGPFEGSKPRQLLITKEQWDAMQAGESGSFAPENEPVEELID